MLVVILYKHGGWDTVDDSNLSFLSDGDIIVYPKESKCMKTVKTVEPHTLSIGDGPIIDDDEDDNPDYSSEEF